MNDSNTEGTNGGLYARTKMTNLSKTVDLIGRLYVDICQQDRLLLNGVPVNVKLWQHTDAFRIMTETGGYKIKITEASLKIAQVKLNPNVILAHAEMLKSTFALYPYTKSAVKTYSVPAGQYSFITDDLFQGAVPQYLLVGIVDSSAVYGAYDKNPFNFVHAHCNYIGFFVDGQSTPSQPLQPDFTNDNFIEAYERLQQEDGRVIGISPPDFKAGYCLYVFNPDGDVKERPDHRAHTRLELRFQNALPRTYTVFVYAKFPALLKIDASRNVMID